MALLWAGQTRTDARSVPTPAAGATIAQVSLGIGHWEAIVSIGFGSAALGANDTATNWQLALAWAGGGSPNRPGSPTIFKLVSLAIVNSMTPMLRIRDIEVDPTMTGVITLTVQNILVNSGATYVAFLAATPFSL